MIGQCYGNSALFDIGLGYWRDMRLKRRAYEVEFNHDETDHVLHVTQRTHLSALAQSLVPLRSVIA